MTTGAEGTAAVPIRDAAGSRVGELVIKVLSRYIKDGALQVVDGAPGAEDSVLLLEEAEYWYQVKVDALGPYRTDRDDVFIWDPDGDQGHLRPGSHVGYLPVTIFAGGEVVGTTQVEVRSRKLNYLGDYQWMLRDIAAASAELLMERFAVTQQYFKAATVSGPTTAYGQFEFLKSVVAPEALGAALEQVQHRPHHQWVLEPELMPAARGVPARGVQLREWLKAGPRVPWANGPTRLRSVPEKVDVHRPHATYDTLPNRFVKFALNRWRAEVDSLQRACLQSMVGPPLGRALRETNAVIDWLDAALGWPVFAEVGELERFPSGNTVLTGREGYREIFAAFGLFELVAGLAWAGGDDVYRAGQRNVATLYEYWCFLQLAALIRRLCGKAEASLIQIDASGTRLDLRRGHQSVITGSVTRLGRKIDLRLFFNRSFAAGAGGDQSWTRAMRPDCSLQLASSDDPESERVWVHFDAKYRIDRVEQIFSDTTEPSEDDEPSSPAGGGRAKRDDLLKMHAYRDAIRRSAGSYVLYPGPQDKSANASYKQFHEVLPGIGAFALRPSPSGEAEGTTGLSEFLEDVLTHHASLLTQERRARYWEGVSFSIGALPQKLSGWQPTRTHPAADTPTLLGYVRSERHLEWILSEGRYNLRLGARRGSVGLEGMESRVELLLLTGPTLSQPRVFVTQPPPEIWSRADLLASGYDSPHGELYLCLRIANEVLVPARERHLARCVALLAFKDGSPRVVSWSDLAGE